jgi:transposase
LTGSRRSLLLAGVSGRATKKQRELRGAPTDVAAKLLDEGRRAEVLALVGELATRNADLEKAIAAMRAAKNRGEHISPDQLEIFLEQLRVEQNADLALANESLTAAADANGGRQEVPKPAKQPSVRRPPPPGLRRIDNEIKVPAAERACPICSAERRCVFHETTEVIDLIPAEVVVRLDRREILACDKCDGEMLRAPMGDKVVEGGIYGSRLVADLVVSKYGSGLPLYRIAEILERLGLSMPSSSMADQITWATDLLRPLWRALIAKTVGCVVMHVDATSLPVRDKETGHQVVLGSLWGYVADEVYALYLYTSTGNKVAQRPGEIGPEDLLRTRRGYVVADAAQIFDKSFMRADLIEIGCNMHYPESSVIRRTYTRARPGRGDRRAPLRISTARSQRLEEAKKIGLRRPSRPRAAHETGPFPERVEDVTLHREVARHVAAGRRDARVAEIISDHGDVDARLEKRDGAAVAKDVGAHARAAQRGVVGRSAEHVLAEDVRDAVSRQLSAAAITKYRGGRVGRRKDLRERGRGIGPERADAILAALSAQSNLMWSRELEVLSPKSCRLADARAGVVEEHEQRVITRADRCRPIGLREDRGDHLRLPVGRGPRPRLLRVNGEDSLVLRGAGDVVPQEVLDKSVYRGEAAVACRGRVVAGGLDVSEEREDGVDRNVVEAERGDRTTPPLGEKQHEQPQGVTVRTHGVPTGAANTS